MNTTLHRWKMGNYQMLVRAEVMRGRFRDSFAEPKPFVEGEATEVNFQLQDILHTFKKGHKVMIQIQSTWFPYIDRNPQKYVDNIYKADEDDFQKATITILSGLPWLRLVMMPWRRPFQQKNSNRSNHVQMDRIHFLNHSD